jgi:5-hydroxyisourate hydrolase
LTADRSAAAPLTRGIYKLVFDVKGYFDKFGDKCFFPTAEVVFELPDTPNPHYHVPLLLSNYSYTTYRGT